MSLVLAALLAAAAPAPERLADLPDETPIHLGVALKLGDPEGLQVFLAALQDPQSPSYHAWIDPATFGARFGRSEAEYAAIVDWFTANGFRVTPAPNRAFLEAVGRVDAVRAAFGVQLHGAKLGGQHFRSFDGEVRLPPQLAASLLHLSGLDTRRRFHHRINATYDGTVYQVLGPDDLRLEYDMVSLAATGMAAANLTTAVLGTQEGTTTERECNNEDNGKTPFIPPSATAVNAYYALGNATATYNMIQMSNPADDFDTCGANQEYQLDVEMQSVGAANATDIDLVLSPSSEVFTTGAQYIVNSVSTAVVVSTSLGLCESEEASSNGGSPTTTGSEMQVLQQTVQQGVAEGQTWFAAAGDEGADDCNDNTSATHNGFGGGNATVDFPGSMPEVVDMGGTQLSGTPSWDSNGNLTAFDSEDVWNEDDGGGGAGGGGQSLYFSKPAYQQGVGPESSDGARDVPDLSLEAASDTPGIAVYDCGSGQDPYSCQGENTGTGTLDIFGGTSVASPLAAGFFAALSGQVGCRLGDIHQTIYALGAAQQSGGPAVFHDIVNGNNTYVDPNNVTITGFSAGAGFDLASGWGSLDVAALIANWPACGSTTTTTTTAASTTSGAAASGTTSGAGTTGGSAATTIASASTSSSGATTGGVSTGTTGRSATSGTTSGHAVTTAASTTSGAVAAATTTGTTGLDTVTPQGCSCGSAPGETFLWLGPLALLWARRRRKA